MLDADQRAIASGIPGLLLMEAAALAVVRVLDSTTGPVAVVCGKGNNGGDGLAIARILQRMHRPVTAFLAHDPALFTADALTQWQALRASGVPARPLDDSLANYPTIVDAILGNGLLGPAHGAAAAAIEAVNATRAHIVAVDIPSGLPSDGLPSDDLPIDGPFVRAHQTVTFHAYKRSHALPPLCHQMGRIHVASIGIPPHDAAIQLADRPPLPPPRQPAHHKGSFGHVLVIAGSTGKAGAAALTGIAALTAGAGLVTVAAPRSVANLISSFAPELMVEPLDETSTGSLAASALLPLRELAAQRDAVALGPGLSLHPETAALARELYATLTQPAIIDADALNALANHLTRATAPRILTPHPGEMSRLTGVPTAEIQRRRLDVALDFAHQHQVTLILKGDRTLTAFRDHRAVINPTGTPAMATAGSGDTLTGILAAFAAHPEFPLDDAAVSAVWLHGRAAQLAAADSESILASSITRHFARALHDARNLP
jgi:NAD(P)H-hydrate epimerase